MNQSKEPPIDHATHVSNDATRDKLLQDTSDTLAIEKKRRRSKPVLILLLALLLAALGGITGLAVYKAYFEPKSTQEQTNSGPTTTPTAKPALSAKIMIDALNPVMSGTVVETGGTTAPPVQNTGYSFYVMPTVDQTANLQKRVEANQAGVDIAAAKKVFADKGLTQKTFSDDPAYTYYLHADVACGLEDKAGSNAAEDHIVAAACYDMSGYVQLSKTAQPYVDVYSKANTADNGDGSELLITGTPKLKDSQTAGYKTVEMNVSGYLSQSRGVGGAVALLYMTPDGTWHYFRSTQNVLSCIDLSTQDLKKAYSGEDCRDDDGQIMKIKAS
jgi:hypothetical protein